MIRRIFTALLLAVALLPYPSIAATHHAKPPPVSSAQLAQFDTEAAAQAHCPCDTVVWINTNSSIYHESGMRCYGRTTHGAHVCRKEADAAGDHDTKKGQ